jgi:uncharacterized protein YecE (DUF72 family)
MAMEAYAHRFPVVEIQHTFYEPPSDALLRKWRELMAGKVEFTMKVWQVVTHRRTSPTYRRVKGVVPEGDIGFFANSDGVMQGWQRSVQCARVLGATAMLFQTPASFAPTPDNIDRMRRFFERIERPPARLLWEPRGPAWIDARAVALSLCADLDLVHVVDPFVTPPAPQQVVYWRLHGIGNARHSYDDEELTHLAHLVKQHNSAAPAYVLFNNLPRVGDASRFVRML